MMKLYDELVQILGEDNIRCDEPMSRHTTFRIGGSADYFATPVSCEQISACIRLLREQGVQYYVVGNGSNLLVSDKGFRGVIIQLGKGFSEVKLEGEEITAQAGAMLSGVARAAMNEGLSGMEFASGIPGTIGGAMCMNAGAYGGEMKDIVTEVTVLENGIVKKLTAQEAKFRYRGSVIADCGMLVLEARLKLNRGDKQAIANTMSELNQKRNEKQPVELPSAGSTFKRPHGYFAAQLIDECGLKGYSVGQAQVSPKHCGFVVNNGGATAAEVMRLIKDVQRIVKEKTGVSLEPEVKIIGQW
jgi:UDP-N-acetylmuramate dehydrogenase